MRATPLPNLAQAPIDPKLWMALILLVVLAFLGGGLIMATKRKLIDRTDPSHSAGGGLLEHLDEMKQSGKITKEEYEQTRSSIINKAASKMREESNEI